MVTPEGLSRVEVVLNNDDEDPDGLSKLACLHLGVADVKDAFHRFKISMLYSSFFALPEIRGQEVGAPWLDVSALVLAAYLCVIPGAYGSVRKRLKRRCGPLQSLRKQKFSRITAVASYYGSKGEVPLTHVIGAKGDSSMSMLTIWKFWEHRVRMWTMT